MELDGKKRKLRIVSGDPASVEAEVNALAENGYAPIQYFVGGSHTPWVVCMCLAESEIRKMALMNQQLPLHQRR